MNAVIQLFESSLTKVIGTFAHNWPYLLASILIGTLIKLFLDKDKVAAYLQNHQKGGVALATAVNRVLGDGCRLKCLNDLVIGRAKLGGLLIAWTAFLEIACPFM